MTERQPDQPGVGVRLLRVAGKGLLMQPRPLAWVLPAAWAAGIFALSSLSSGDRPPLWWEFGGLTANCAHPVMFGILALLLVPLAPRRGSSTTGRWTDLSPAGALWLLLVVVLYGFTDELHQSTVPGRDASLLDLVSDGVGAAAVLAVVTYLGAEDANAHGLRKRFAIGAVASLLVAGLATLWGRTVGEGPWPF